jgi:hypothetical protein
MSESLDIERLLADNCLIVDFCDDISVLRPGETLTFGREADIPIDDNEFLHRQLGKFETRDDRWWVGNIGSRIEFEVFDRATRASAKITPGTAQPLPGSDMILQFAAGPTGYELLVHCSPPGAVETAEPSDTLSLASIAWADEQRLLFTILAESLLRRPHAPLTLPTNQEARSRLGWSEAKFNRKLDNVCDRLTSSGIRGLSKGVNKRNNQRRAVLAETAVTRGIVDNDDLRILEEYEDAVRSAAPQQESP